jgi:hypothetical protein
MNFHKVFDTLLQPEVSDEDIKRVYDYSKENQYTEGRLSKYMTEKLGFDFNDKKYKPTQEEVKKLVKLLGNFTIREMIKVMENPKYDDEDKKDKKTKKRVNKRSNRKKKKKKKKSKSGGADLGNLFKNIKSFPAYKKMYRSIHAILHNYFRIEGIKSNKMKDHILDMKPMQYMGIFTDPKYN